MRPEGCQENRPSASFTDDFSQLTDFKTVLSLVCLTLLKSGPYTGSLTERRVLHAALLLVALALIGPARPLAQAIQRSMYVSALDEAGAPVPDLGPSDFIVREDNVAREVLRVAPADAPMQVAVLVDNSEAARDAVPDIRRALPEVVDAMTAAAAAGGKNDLSIVTLAERPTIVTDYTADRAQLQKGIGRIFAQSRSASYLLEAIIEVSRGFKKREAQRPVIVAIATEGPEYSSRYFEQVLGPLHDAGAAFHAIVLGSPSSDISDDAHNRNVVLAEGTRSTGGRYDNLLASSALPAAMKRVAAELTHQYLVTYARPQSLIPPDKVTVSAARSGMTARGILIKAQQERGRP
jgi:von Willebrand factor type A domain